MSKAPNHNNPRPKDGETLRGSGPVPGVIEISDRLTSVAAFLNYRPSFAIRTWHDGVMRQGGVYVFDPVREIFSVGNPTGISGSPHQKLARSIGVEDYDRVVGGTWTRGADGAVVTTEQSGHYGDNWGRNPDVRK